MSTRREDQASKDIQSAITKVRDYWLEGHESLQQHGERAPYGESSEWLRKARRFAHRYTEKQLNALLDKCERHEFTLGTSFIDRLVTVPDRRERSALETKVVKERWSRARLDREIRSRYGSRRNLGRRPSQPTSTSEALSALSRLATKLTRWGAMMGWNPDTDRVRSDVEGNVSLTDLPKDVSSLAKEVFHTVYKLQIATDNALYRDRA